MIFRKKNEEPIEFTLKNQTIPYKEISYSQEMTLDSILIWEEHINRARVKAK